jgi:hypothetical protein
MQVDGMPQAKRLCRGQLQTHDDAAALARDSFRSRSI